MNTAFPQHPPRTTIGPQPVILTEQAVRQYEALFQVQWDLIQGVPAGFEDSVQFAERVVALEDSQAAQDILIDQHGADIVQHGDDISALDAGKSDVGHTHVWSEVSKVGALPGDVGAAALLHTHDDRYYTETESNTLLAGKAAAIHTHAWGDVSKVGALPGDVGAAALGHIHDDRYFTEAEVTSLLSGKAALVHTHAWGDVSKAGSSLADLSTRSAGDLSSGTLPAARVIGAYGGITGVGILAEMVVTGTIETDRNVLANFFSIKDATNNIRGTLTEYATLSGGGSDYNTVLHSEGALYLTTSGSPTIKASLSAAGSLELFSGPLLVQNSMALQGRKAGTGTPAALVYISAVNALTVGGGDLPLFLQTTDIPNLRVTLGANDSGGTGKRALVVDNA